MSSRNRTGGQLIVEALEGAGVSHCFGVPGESFLGILDALYDSPIEVVSTRHEGGASFMASGYAKTSGEVGVCFGTRAVGTANLAIGVHNARQDSTPMLAFAGQVNRAFAGREAFQEVDLVAAMTPFSKWATHIPSADAVPEVMARALNVATSGRPGPVFIAVPQDVCDELSEAPSWPPTQIATPYPDPAAVSAVVDALLGASHPLIFAGGGLYSSDDALNGLVRFAELTEIPVITSWRHHDEFPNDHRLFLGSAGLATSPTVWDRLANTDVVVVLGNRMQEITTDGYRFPAHTTRLFQVDIDPAVMVNHRSPEIGIHCDAAAMLSAMTAALPDPIPGIEQRRQHNVVDRHHFEAATTIPAAEPGVGVAYAEVIQTLTDVLSPETIVATDAGNFYGWLSRYYRFRRPHTYLGPASGAMGYGLPSAIGAKIARPNTPVVSLSGDGGFLMTIAELETAARRRANVVAVVLDNARQGTIRMHQQAQHPGRVIGTELGTTDLSMVAHGLGLDGYLVTEHGDFEPALRAALHADTPTVIQVRMDRAQLSVQARLPTPDDATQEIGAG